MTKNFENFLLGLLWLLSISLAVTFWMNINYGFNVLSSAHWAYLSELQASRTQIKFDFYISLISAIVIGLVGLYIIVRPRDKKITASEVSPESKFDIPRTQVAPQKNTQKSQIQEHAAQIEPVPSKPKIIVQNRPLSPSGISSPVHTPRQTLTPPTEKVVPPVPTLISEKPNIAKSNSELQTEFETLGYIIKPCNKIGKITKPVVALGYDNTLWIGASKESVKSMQDSIQTLISIFDDTLGDSASDIIVHGCIVDTNETSDNPELISTFTNINEFKGFMNDKYNKKPDDFDDDLFDAISTYISTVTNYIGKE